MMDPRKIPDIATGLFLLLGLFTLCIIALALNGCAALGTPVWESQDPGTFQIGPAECRLVKISGSSWLCCNADPDNPALFCKPELPMKKPRLHDADDNEVDDHGVRI